MIIFRQRSIEKNAGGLIYNDADFVGAWDSFFDENGQAMSSLAIFAYAQGNQVDVSTYKDPWEYGGDTGLKNLTASVKNLIICHKVPFEEWIFHPIQH